MKVRGLVLGCMLMNNCQFGGVHVMRVGNQPSLDSALLFMHDTLDSIVAPTSGPMFLLHMEQIGKHRAFSRCKFISFASLPSLNLILPSHEFIYVRSKRHWAEKNPDKTSPKKDEAVARPEAGSIQPIASFGDGGSKVAVAAASSEKDEGNVVDDNIIPPPPPPAKTTTSDAAPTTATKTATIPAVKAPAQQAAAPSAGKVPAAAPAKPITKVDEKKTTTSPVAGEKRPAEAEATAVSGAPSSSSQPSGERHLPQKKRKVEIDAEAASAEAGPGAGVEPKAAPSQAAAATSTTQSAAPTTTASTAAAAPASSAASPSTKKDGIHQESDGKWSAAVLHTDGQSYGLGATFDTKELATLALGAFRSTLANESRAAGGRISESMVKQAREMARHAALAKGRNQGSVQKQM